MSSLSTQREYRYVIVGAGTAGCLLAHLLKRNQAGSVALIEAGSNVENVRSRVPQLYPHLFGSVLDWGFKTTSQVGLSGRSIGWPRGKMVGGSGAMNALIHLQAAQADFQRWGWPLADVARQVAALREIAPLDAVATPHPWSLMFLDSARACGLDCHPAWLQSVANTCGLYQLTSQNGRRWHSGQLVRHESKDDAITIIPKAQVTRLRFDQSRVSGVVIVHDSGCHETLYATDTVILCGGSIGTPELLLKSGVGDAADLYRAGLTCVHELPWVGKNLQDHLVYPIIFKTRTTAGLTRRHSRADCESYRGSGTGPLASNIAEAGALFNLDPCGSANSTPQCQIHFTPTHYLKFPKTRTDDCYLSLGVTDLHPTSRGELKLLTATSAGRLQIAIDPRYLTESIDRERYVEAIQRTRQLVEKPGLHAVVAEELLPGAKRTSDKSLLKSLITFAQSIYHPVGTCRMDCGKEHGAERAVVDDQFRVHGLTGLRIVDASVLPDLPSGNTNAVTLLLALRAAMELSCN